MLADKELPSASPKALIVTSTELAPVPNVSNVRTPNIKLDGCKALSVVSLSSERSNNSTVPTPGLMKLIVFPPQVGSSSSQPSTGSPNEKLLNDRVVKSKVMFTSNVPSEGGSPSPEMLRSIVACEPNATDWED